MSGHTKGPWKVELRTTAHLPWSYCINVDAGQVSEDEAEANARLFAAAPDLLAALHLAAEALDAYSDVNDGQEGPTPNTAMSALQEIDAVIARAEGTPR